MLIRVSNGKTCAKVLGKISAKGSNKEEFTEEVNRVIEGLDEVRVGSRKVTLEIRDFDHRSVTSIRTSPLRKR